MKAESKEVTLDGDLIGVSERETRRCESCLLLLCSIQGGFQAYIGSRTAVILYNSLKLLDHIGGVLDGDFYPFKVF